MKTSKGKTRTEMGYRAPDWEGLGLAGNPFENVEPGERPEWIDWPAGLREAISRDRFAVQLLGPHRGAGKSTLARACQAVLLARGVRAVYRYLHPDERWRGEVPEGTDAFLVDEADRASAPAIERLGAWQQRTGGSLLLATHRPCALPGLTTFELEALPLRAWIGRRVASATLPGRVAPDFSRWVPQAARKAGGVNYGIQRILYELAEEWARGAPDDDATFAAAVGRAAPDLLSR